MSERKAKDVQCSCHDFVSEPEPKRFAGESENDFATRINVWNRRSIAELVRRYPPHGYRPAGREVQS
jgi:hypothetical protein